MSALLLLATAPTARSQTYESGAAQKLAADANTVVDCLLPGAVRRLGAGVTYLAARRPVLLKTGECEVRGAMNQRHQVVLHEELHHPRDRAVGAQRAEDLEQLGQFVRGMRSLTDQLVQIVGRNPQVARDTVELDGIELTYLI